MRHSDADGTRLAAAASRAFKARYGTGPEIIVRAPGRVNLIGEHTDYNGGWVLPMAIDRETVIVACPRADRQLRIWSEDYQAEEVVSLDRPQAPATPGWPSYVAGVAACLGPDRLPRGADALVVGSVPQGSGLSSSASFEMALVGLFEWLGGLCLEDGEAARIGQAVEHRYLGLACGIMDQFVSRAARAGHALYLNCATLEHTHVPAVLPGHRFVIADSRCPRRLSASVYNERVAETRTVLLALNAAHGRSADRLSAYALDDLEMVREAIGAVPFRRARHFFAESRRTEAACRALLSGDAVRFGQLMDASHESLRYDYAVSSRELDTLRDLARGMAGCIGARMTGAGFGGCTVNLVRSDSVSEFQESLQAQYALKIGYPCTVFSSTAAPGMSKHVTGYDKLL